LNVLNIACKKNLQEKTECEESLVDLFW